MPESRQLGRPNPGERPRLPHRAGATSRERDGNPPRRRHRPRHGSQESYARRLQRPGFEAVPSPSRAASRGTHRTTPEHDDRVPLRNPRSKQRRADSRFDRAWLRSIPTYTSRSKTSEHAGHGRRTPAVPGLLREDQTADTSAPRRTSTSPAWFRKARACVESTGCPWGILSAEYGLLHPDEEIRPYEKTLNAMPVAEKRALGVRSARVDGPVSRGYRHGRVLRGRTIPGVSRAGIARMGCCRIRPHAGSKPRAAACVARRLSPWLTVTPTPPASTSC